MILGAEIRAKMTILGADFMLQLRPYNLQCLMFLGAEFSVVFSTMLG